MESKIQPELKDVLEAINRFVAVNKDNACFVGGFLVYKEDDLIRDDGMGSFAYGDKFSLRMILNVLRNTIEDKADEENFVKI
jgi:hypothetical protein